VATALCFAAAAVAPTFWALLVVVAVSGPASGCAIGLSQATVVDARPEAADRALARWSLFATLGDLAAPAILAALGVFALGHRAALLVVAALTLAFAAVTARALPAERAPVEAEPSLLENLRQAWHAARATPELVVWAIGCLLCTLLDETLVAFGASYMHHALGASATTRAIAFGAWTAGSFVGLAIADRLLSRAPPLKVLAVSSLACAAAHVTWLFIPSPLAAIGGLFAIGVTACCHYPIAKARAYAAVPGRSGLVNAVLSVLLPVEIAIPIALGAIADHVSTRAALLALLVQPLGLFVIAVRALRARPSRNA
jgi:predicted MFS family arabinose efflux permease